MNLKPGKFYTIKGGHILRFNGVYGKPWGTLPKGNENLAFSSPESEIAETATGYSCSQDDVLYEMTAENSEGLARRWWGLRFRNMSTADIEVVLTSLELPVPPPQPSIC